MKTTKIIIPVIAFLCIFNSCKNKSEQNRTETISIDKQNQQKANDGYSLQVFTGNDNKEYSLIFNNNSQIPTVLLQSENIEKLLTQTEAWAKGAEYGTDDVKLTVTGGKATLIVNDKTIELTGK